MLSIGPGVLPMEKLSLLRVQEKNLFQKDYTELGWLEKCKDYFIRHGFETRYAQQNSSMRNKNYLELEKHIAQTQDRIAERIERSGKGH